MVTREPDRGATGFTGAATGAHGSICPTLADDTLAPGDTLAAWPPQASTWTGEAAPTGIPQASVVAPAPTVTAPCTKSDFT